MWHIEHISLRGKLNSPVLRKTSFSDIIQNGDIVPTETSTHQTYFDTTNLVNQATLPNHIHFNQLYGRDGATVSDLASTNRTDILVEIPANWLLALTADEFTSISSKHHILITDFEDGGMYINIKLIKYLIGIRCVPKKTIYYITSSILLNDVPHLNLKHIHIPYWLFNHGAIAYDYHRHRYNDSIAHITGSVYPNKLLFLNFKPRLYRMKALIELSERGILDSPGVSWSLINSAPAFDNPQPCTTDNYFNLDIDVSDEMHTQNCSRLSTTDADRYRQFISRYTLPKTHSLSDNHIQTWLPAETDHAAYQWNFAVETHYGDEIPLRNRLGTASFMTEKTYKSFTQASMPVILCAGDTNKYLTDQGFLLDDMPFSATVNQIEKFEQVIDFIERIVQDDIKPDVDKLVHNFKHITDIEHTAKVFTHYLENLSDAIDG